MDKDKIDFIREQAKLARDAVDQRKRDNPYLFPEWLDLQCAERELVEAERRYKEALEKWRKV